MTRDTMIEEVVVGTRTIAGTEWRVVDQLHRTGPREWTVVRELCNGVSRGTETFRSESAAREAFGRRVGGTKPRTGVASRVLNLRVSDDERTRWQGAADRAGVSLSEWIRTTLDQRITSGGST